MHALRRRCPSSRRPSLSFSASSCRARCSPLRRRTARSRAEVARSDRPIRVRRPVVSVRAPSSDRSAPAPCHRRATGGSTMPTCRRDLSTLRVARRASRRDGADGDRCRRGDRTVDVALALSAVAESVVVSAAQVESPLVDASPDSVTVITRRDLRDAAEFETLGDALRTVPGLDGAAAAAAAARSRRCSRAAANPTSRSCSSTACARTRSAAASTSSLLAARRHRAHRVRARAAERAVRRRTRSAASCR